MIAKIELSEEEIYKAIAQYIQRETNISVDPNCIRVEVKSKQNYKSEWEQASIRCIFDAQAAVAL